MTQTRCNEQLVRVRVKPWKHKWKKQPKIYFKTYNGKIIQTCTYCYFVNPSHDIYVYSLLKIFIPNGKHIYREIYILFIQTYSNQTSKTMSKQNDVFCRITASNYGWSTGRPEVYATPFTTPREKHFFVCYKRCTYVFFAEGDFSVYPFECFN